MRHPGSFRFTASLTCMSRTLLTLAAAAAIVFTSLPASAQCTSNLDCGAGTPVCDGGGVCVECITDGDCGGGTPFCDSGAGFCVECKVNSHCSSLQRDRCDVRHGLRRQRVLRRCRLHGHGRRVLRRCLCVHDQHDGSDDDDDDDDHHHHHRSDGPLGRQLSMLQVKGLEESAIPEPAGGVAHR